jgi:protein involved in polysaccharide export with SLBB domain
MFFVLFERAKWVPAFMVVLLVGCADRSDVPLPPVMLPPPAAPVGQTNDVFIPGDSLELFVEEDPSFNGTYPIREGGYILIPRIGRIQISGLNREGAERHITQTLQKGQLAKAKVLVEHIKLGRSPALSSPETPKIMVYLTGSVAKPGVHLLPLVKSRPMGLYEALLITGGLTRFGNHGKVEILRADSSGRRARTVVDIRPIRDGKADDPPLSEGDIINVSEKVFGF